MANASSAPGKSQFNVYLPTALIRTVRHCAIDEGRSMSAVIEAAITAYLDTLSAQTRRELKSSD